MKATLEPPENQEKEVVIRLSQNEAKLLFAYIATTGGAEEETGLMCLADDIKRRKHQLGVATLNIRIDCTGKLYEILKNLLRE